MQIYANKNIRIDESLSDLRSSITILGNINYGTLVWGERNELKKFLDERVNWKEAIASITFVCLEDDKEQKHNELGWICMDGTFELNKESKYFAIRCSCTLTPNNWLNLKNYLFLKNDNNFGVEFNITQIHAGRIVETEEAFESKIELYMESYSINKFSKKIE
jgi:hypothetical protein